MTTKFQKKYRTELILLLVLEAEQCHANPVRVICHVHDHVFIYSLLNSTQGTRKNKHTDLKTELKPNFKKIRKSAGA